MADTVTMDYNLRPLRDAILDVYKEVYRICERHGLRVYVAFGTEIGAMRHHGFIPWDDDFDVLMPRPDYDKFIKYAQQELPHCLKWHSIETDAEYGLFFGKVCEERADVVASVRRDSNLSLAQGIFVDVFPMDGLPSTKFGVLLWNCCRSVLRRYVRPSKMTIQRFVKLFDYDRSSNVGWCFSTFRFPKYIYKKDWFDGARMVPFEDVEVPVPIQVEQHLSSLYGDYMKLPPEEMRVPSHQTLK